MHGDREKIEGRPGLGFLCVLTALILHLGGNIFAARITGMESVPAQFILLFLYLGMMVRGWSWPRWCLSTLILLALAVGLYFTLTAENPVAPELWIVLALMAVVALLLLIPWTGDFLRMRRQETRRRSREH